MYLIPSQSSFTYSTSQALVAWRPRPRTTLYLRVSRELKNIPEDWLHLCCKDTKTLNKVPQNGTRVLHGQTSQTGRVVTESLDDTLLRVPDELN